MALATTRQEDFSAGIHRGRKAPANAVYDAVNALINDEGLLHKRGGDAFWSASNTGAAEGLYGLGSLYFPAPQAVRNFAWAGANFYGFDDSEVPNSSTTSGAMNKKGRPTSVGGYAIVPRRSGLVLYAGSQEGSTYTTGTVTVTADSVTVTGSGTSWASNVDAGMILTVSGSIAIVASVDSDTSITLLASWSGSTASGASYSLSDTSGKSVTFTQLGTDNFVAAAGSGSPRLLASTGNRVYVSDRGDPTVIDTDTFIELPSGAVITGLEGIGDSALIFTTDGIWRVDNLSLDAVDAFGNIQWVQTQINKDALLWDNRSITGWSGGTIFAARDDVFVLSPDGGVVSLTGTPAEPKIRPLYRSYVANGYSAGMATVFRGHYLLPILNTDEHTWVDTLVCRLDRGAAWTRWDGHAAASGFTLAADADGSVTCYGINARRIIDATDCFDPTTSNASDADSTAHSLTVITRDYDLGADQPGFAQRLRARYVLEDDGSSSPTVTPAFSSDEDDDAYTALTDKGEQEGGTGWAESDGSKYQWATVSKRRHRVRFKLTQQGAAGSFVLRALTVLLRPSGKQ